MDHEYRVQWLMQYDEWRKTVQQTWDVRIHQHKLEKLVLMVNDCHAFMQNTINEAVCEMHGSRAATFHSTPVKLNWNSILQQLHGYPTST